MLLRQAARPSTGGELLQRLRFADPFERIPQDRIDDIERAQRDAPVRIHPESQILAKLRMENRDAFSLHGHD